MYSTIYNSPIGALRITADDDAVTTLNFHATGTSGKRNRVIALCLAELDAYFKGELRTFSIPLRLEGTEYRKRVWQALLTVPFGETITYGELAAKAGNPKAARAVGGAMHNNPIPILVPCHRVIGANGSLTGFGGGLDIKRKLLSLEGVEYMGNA